MRLLAIVGAALAVQCVNAGFGHAHPQNPLNGGVKREVVAKRQLVGCSNIDCRIVPYHECCNRKREVVVKREAELAPCPPGEEDSGYPFHWPNKCKRAAIDIDWRENDYDWAGCKGHGGAICNDSKCYTWMCRDGDCWRGAVWEKAKGYGRRRGFDLPFCACKNVDCGEVSRESKEWRVCCDTYPEPVAKREVARPSGGEDGIDDPNYKREVVAKREAELAPCPAGVPEDSGYPYHWPTKCKREAVVKREVARPSGGEDGIDDPNFKREVVAKRQDYWECRGVDCSIAFLHVCCGRKREVVAKSLPAF